MDRQRLLDHLPGLVYQCRNDEDWSMEFVSRGCRALTGYEPGQIRDGEVTYASIIHPADRDRVWAEVQAALESDDEFKLVYRIITSESQEKWVWEQGCALDPGHERLVGFICDLSERKRFEERLQQSQRLEAIGQLAGSIAHDFNNLLTVITGYGEFALRAIGKEHDAREDLEQVVKAGRRAAQLTGKLLTFSRQQPIEPDVVNLNLALQSALELIERLLGPDIDLRVVLSETPVNLVADPSQLEQVVMNLVVNARDAMPDGGKLTIEIASVDLDDRYLRERPNLEPGRYAGLAVTDTGCGMDRETLEHIFEPFFTTKEPDSGTGLGLSTVYGIVRQHGGDIWAYSEPGQGATFKVYFPQVDSAAQPVPAERSPVECAGGGETVLVVEDDDSVRDIAARILNECGYEVLEARGADEALSIVRAREGPIELILTDVVMPGLGGTDVAARLRTELPDARVLYMSGHTGRALEHRGEITLDAPFLPKPFSRSSLSRKVREVLGARPS